MVSTELQCVRPLTVSFSAKVINVAAWLSDAKAMSLQGSIHLLGRHVLHGVENSSISSVAILTILMIRLLVDIASIKLATNSTRL